MNLNHCRLLLVAAVSFVLAHEVSAIDVAPPASSDHRMVYDTARQESVLFGVFNSAGGSTQTWVWNGNWSRKSPSASPPGVKLGSLAYDEARQRTVFFGGALGGLTPAWTNNNATWLWDGTNWSVTTPTVRPPASFSGAMAYDAVRQNTVLFGGDQRTVGGNTPTMNMNDTWVWNGSDWTSKNPVNRPSVRSSCGLAFDAARGEIVLFGGLNNNGGGGDFNDTWVWNGTNWFQKSPAASPPALHVSGMVYDSARREIVLFGGFRITGGYNETWTWNGTNWFLKTPSIKPSLRAEHAMAFDTVRQKVVLYGGDSYPNGMPLGDTWLWDGTNWSSSEMTLSLTNSPNPVRLGSNVIFSVSVTNRGPSRADEVRLVQEFSAAANFVSATTSQGSCSFSNGTVVCDLGSVNTNINVTVTIAIAPLTPATLTNTATLLCLAELNPSNNVAKTTTTVFSPPIITVPLSNQTVGVSGQTALGVSVIGSAPLTYQWFFNGTNVANTSTLTLSNLIFSQGGLYTVIVSNAYGAATNTALVSVSDLKMYAGVRIGGSPGAAYEIDARNSFNTNDGWFTLTNFTLPSSPYLFIDENSPNYPQRFYRVIAP